jgi:predicted nucleotide-binding protein
MATNKATAKKKGAAAKPKTKRLQNAPRSYMSQEDVPSCGLNEALRVGAALVDQYGGRAASPLDVAAALNLQPSSSGFRMLCGASIAYGITSGGYNAQEISLTAVGKRVLNPLVEGDDMVAKREAILKPRVLREFLSKYSGAALPRDDIATNVLRSMGVPAERAASVHALILESAEGVGFLRQIKEKRYVDLGGTAAGTPVVTEEREAEVPVGSSSSEATIALPAPAAISAAVISEIEIGKANRRVFITHGKNMAFIEPIKKLLGFGELVPVVSVEKQSVSQPVPDKVMNDLRSCSAAIIHVDSEQTLIDREAKEHTVINPNVLIEIGAAMALFGRRFILLVREGVKLPSNLQGLYEVRYDGDALDGTATIRLLEAINDIKNNPLPSPTGITS